MLDALLARTLATDALLAPVRPLPAPAVITVRANDFVVKLPSGKSLQDDMAALASGTPPAWAVRVGGPNAAPPAGTVEATLTLEPGNRRDGKDE